MVVFFDISFVTFFLIYIVSKDPIHFLKNEEQTMVLAQRRKEIFDMVHKDPCELDFKSLNDDELSTAIRFVISARLHNEFKVDHFNNEQLKFIENLRGRYLLSGF